MSETETTSTRKTTRSSPPKSSVELPAYEDALEQGYIGVAVDTRDDSEYTVEGSAARAEAGPPDITVEVDPQHTPREQTD